MIFGESSECGELFFFGGFYSFELFYFLFEFGFYEVAFLFVEDVHVLKSDFIAINTGEPILELFYCVWSVIFVLSAEVFYHDLFFQFLGFVSEFGGIKTMIGYLSVDFFVLREIKGIYF